MPEHVIVVVDDEEELRCNPADPLESKAYTVHAYTGGEEMRSVIQEAEVSGVDKVVHKPYSQAEMMAVIEESLA